MGSNIAGALILIFSISCFSNLDFDTIQIKLIHFLIFISVAIISSIAFLSPLGCGLEAKGALSLIFLAALLSFHKKIDLVRIVISRSTTNFALTFLLVLLFLDLLGLGVRQLIFGFSKGSGPYTETSHLAIYLLPILAVQLLMIPKNRLAWLVLLFCSFFAFSSTLSVGLLGIFWMYSFSRPGSFIKRWSLLMVVVLVIFTILFSGIIDVESTTNRVLHILGGYDAEVANHTNMSSIVWLNGWSQAGQTLLATGWLGTGFNQMGCGRFYASGMLSPLMMDTMAMVLNFDDGSLLAAKLIAELGILGIITVFVLSSLSVRAIVNFGSVRFAITYEKRLFATIRAAGGWCILMYLYVRGMGYFQMSFLLSISMLLLSPSRQLTGTSKCR